MSGPWWDDTEPGVMPPQVPRPVPARDLWADRYTPPAPRRRVPWARLAVGAAVAAVAAVLLWGAWGDSPPDSRSAEQSAAPFTPDRPERELSAPSAGASTTAPAEGHDHGDAPAPPDELAAEPHVYPFVLGYLTYSPAVPDPVDTWLAGWESHAAPELVDGAAAASRLYDFTVGQAVHVTDPRVLMVTGDGAGWTLRCRWTLFAVGGDETTVGVDEDVVVHVVTRDGLVASVTVTRQAGAPA